MTIKDLAKATGYSVATISRVLNNHPSVSQKAREEITRAVAETGFQINTNAKQLKQHANSVLVVVKGTSNEMFGEMIETIQKLIDQTDYPLHVDYMDEDNNEVLRAVETARTSWRISVKLIFPACWCQMMHPVFRLTTSPVFVQMTGRLHGVRWIH